MKQLQILTVALLLSAWAHSARGENHVVLVSSNTFTPSTLNIRKGDTVTFINQGGFHNVQADDDSFRCANGCDNDGNGGDGSPASNAWQATVQFDQEGSVPYFCAIHGGPGGSGMSGLIVVQGTNHQVITNGLTFVPDDLTIATGDSVTFTNDDQGLHNVNADDDSFRCANGCDGDGGNGDPSTALWEFTLPFDVAGDVPYHCDVHVGAGMTGIIRVIEDVIFANGFE